MLSLNELEAYLKEHRCDFEIIAHDMPIKTLNDAKRYFDIEKAAPTLAFETERGLIAVIVGSGRGRVDPEALKRAAGCESAKMADKSKVLAATGYTVGAMPFIGHGLPCIIDKQLLAFDYIYGGSGDERHTLKIAPSDLIRLHAGVKFIE